MSDDHVLVNRDSWDKDAPNWVERGREAWALEEPVWGRGNPESDLHLLPDVRGLDAIELGCGTLIGRGSIPVDAAEDHAGQWVFRRVASNGIVSVDNQMFSVGNACKAELVDVFVDDTVIQVWSKNYLIKTVARTRTGRVRKVRADASTSSIS